MVWAALGQAVDADAERQAAVAAVVARQRAIQNIEVRYTVDETFSPDLGIPPHPNFEPFNGLMHVDALFRLIDGTMYFERRADPNRQDGNPIDYETHFNSPDRDESLMKSQIRTFASGVVSAHQPLPYNSYVDMALGLRAVDNQESWLAADTWGGNGQTQTLGADGDLSLESGTGDRHLWTFDRQLGFALIQYKVIYAVGGQVTIDASDFRNLNGLMLPYRIQWSGVDAGGVERHRVTLQVQGYAFGEAVATSGMAILFPDGARVADRRQPDSKGHVVIKGGPRVLDDAWLDQALLAAAPPPAAAETGTISGWKVGLNVGLTAGIAAVLAVRSARWVRARRSRQLVVAEGMAQ